jgi:hypothetical protein
MKEINNMNQFTDLLLLRLIANLQTLIEQQLEQIDALETAIRNLTTHDGTPDAYVGFDGFHPANYCHYCGNYWKPGELPENHDDDCPVASARELLNNKEQ